MDTPYTLRAAQLKDLYNSVTETDLSRDERLDVLLTLKATVRVRQLGTLMTGVDSLSWQRACTNFFKYVKEGVPVV